MSTELRRFNLTLLSLSLGAISCIRSDPSSASNNITNEIILGTPGPLSYSRHITEQPTSPSHTRGKSFFLPRRITASHVAGTGAGIGYAINYTTLEVLFASLYHPGGFVPMIDLRGHRFDNNTYAANAGIVVRYIPNHGSFCQMLGFNVYYDYRQGNRGIYNQVGVGVESLGSRWDFRANGYIPVGKMSHKLTCVFDQYNGDFFMVRKKEEIASYGFNAEVGYLIVNSKHFLLYSATGPYYLSKKWHRQALGWEFRLRPQYKDYIAIDLETSYDPIFQWVFQTKFILTLPLYQIPYKNNKAPCGITNRQVYQPVERFEIIPLRRRCCFQSNF